MGRLIDADKLKESLGTILLLIAYRDRDGKIKRIMDVINNQPTAYDVDKVVEQLKECERYVYDAVSDEDNYVIDAEKAIEIVKGGGKA